MPYPQTYMKTTQGQKQASNERKCGFGKKEESIARRRRRRSDIPWIAHYRTLLHRTIQIKLTDPHQAYLTKAEVWGEICLQERLYGSMHRLCWLRCSTRLCRIKISGIQLLLHCLLTALNTSSHEWRLQVLDANLKFFILNDLVNYLNHPFLKDPCEILSQGSLLRRFNRHLLALLSHMFFQ